MSSTETWRALLRKILAADDVTQTGRNHEPRDRRTKEVVASQSRWSMSDPTILCPHRKMGRKFALAEAAWILSGSNRLEDVAPRAPYLRKFSDDGLTLSGAYGPKFVDQVAYVTECLRRDPRSRQAVATLWRERPGPSKDVPCTLALQWLVRDGRLHCVATMRSSDAWLGVPYDVFTFSALSTSVAVRLNREGVDCSGLGWLHLTAGSQHLYAIDWDAAEKCAGESLEAVDSERVILRPSDFDHPDEIVAFLKKREEDVA